MNPQRSFRLGIILGSRIIRTWQISSGSRSLCAAAAGNRTPEDAVGKILFQASPARNSSDKFHTLCALVNNEPGVLSRISGILASRGFNIDSLVVGGTEVPDLSRMTIRIRGKENVVHQAKKQLEDLVPVWAVIDYSEAKTIEREMLLVKVATFGNSLNSSDAIYQAHLQRQTLKELAELFNAKILDVGTEHVVIELTAKSSRINAFMELISPLGIIESSRTGAMVMARSRVSGLTHSQEDEINLEDDDEQIDIASLPPS